MAATRGPGMGSGYNGVHHRVERKPPPAFRTKISL